jgi:hypothetical protein
LNIFGLGFDKKSISRTSQHRQRLSSRHHFAQQVEALCGNLGAEKGDTGEIAPRTIEGRHDVKLDRIDTRQKDDRDRPSRLIQSD